MTSKEEQQLIKSAGVHYSEYRGGADEPAWYGQFALNAYGFVITGKTPYFETIDEAVASLKEKMAAAVAKFAPTT